MINNIAFLSLLLYATFGFSQDDMPNDVHEVINWSQSVNQKGCEATITFTVDQKDGWHVYSQEQPTGAVAYPTEFIFQKSSDYELVGTVKEIGAELHGGQFPERSFPGTKAIFKQKIKIKTDKDFVLHVDYVYMACKEACFPPIDEFFDIKLKGCKGEATTENIHTDSDATDETSNVNETQNSEEDNISNTSDSIIVSPIAFETFLVKKSTTEYEYHLEPKSPSSWVLLVGENDFKLDITGKLVSKQQHQFLGNVKDTIINNKSYKLWESGNIVLPFEINEADSTQAIKSSFKFAAIGPENKLFTSDIQSAELSIKSARVQALSDESKTSYWGIFWLAFAGGLVALLTPCVFPMIPMTVSFFTKGSKDKKKGLFRGVMYGFFILLIYVLLSVPFHLVDSLNPNILNNIATNGPLNIFFFIMLFVFGLSFLGAFEIVLPAKWTNKADSKSDLGGLIGIFFMALTLALVSFSCTGPILGSLLANAAGGGAWNLTWGMAGFGVALGLPFALFAIFPSWLNSLPSSGGWLNNVKVVLGFLEIAFAFKFLSNADLSVQAHLLEREVFIAIWIAIFGAMTLYLFNIFSTKHDSPVNGGIGTFRIIIATLSLMFTVYMLPGLFGAPLKLISAFPPPTSYSEIPYGIHGHAPEGSMGEDGIPEGAEFEHNLMVFHNYDLAKKYADEIGKPLMLDFTGHNCVNCRKMEINVWSAERVYKLMNEEFVIASLPVDERIKMPKEEVSPYTGRILKTWGDKWADMQSALYKKNTQPQYIALDKGGQIMNTDATYRSHGNPDAFESWLKAAKEEYVKRGDVITIKGKGTLAEL
ncbi:MAG: cytochrome c biogenesis protein CcdA [Putridiphycobacter sp.]|nr:cytochrome c biogenesis protein CcdA [Putridiphycobacter sp.]